MSKSLFFSIGVAAFALADVGVIMGLSLHESAVAAHNARIAEQNAEIAKELAQADATRVAKYSKSPFQSVTLNRMTTLDGQPVDFARTIFTYPCTIYKLLRLTNVTEDTQVIIAKSLLGAGNAVDLQLAMGSEFFRVAANPNRMTPTIQIPSNVPRYTYLRYATVLGDITRYAPPLPMQDLSLFILDVGQPLPKPGEPVPKGPLPGLPPVTQPVCPAIISATAGSK